ncbi:MAG: hypothetical protein LBR43_01120 [Spiroplasmataceae bacterium]|nr:hypothetical protein [Spiroplasmataceae bacterium]
MSSNFKFLREYKKDEELLWEYSHSFIINRKLISYLTITDHYSLKHKAKVNNELICKLFNLLSGTELKPAAIHSFREIYVEEIIYQNQSYRLIFWFKDNTINHLWVKNCYPIN